MRNVDPELERLKQEGEGMDFLARGAGRLPAGEEAGNPDLPESFGAGTGQRAGTEAFGRGEGRDEKDQKSKEEAGGVQEPGGDHAEEKAPGAARLKGPRWETRIRSGAGAPMAWTIRSQPAENPEGAGKKKEGEHAGAEGPEEVEPKGEDNDGDPGGKKDRKPPVYKRPWAIVVAIVLVLLLIGGGVAWWLYERQFASTDDAYIDGNVTQISPQVSGQILRRYVDDNTLVRKGDLMVELDPTDFEVGLQRAQAAVEAARAKLGQAQTQVAAAEATVAQNQAEIDAAQVHLDNASADLKRYQDVDPRARTQQQLDNATAAQKNAAAEVAQAEARKNTAQANVKAQQAAVDAAQGDLKSALADERQAQVNLGYCNVRAPSDGRVTSRSIDVGMYVGAGQAMFSLVSPDVWVTANFKETQLADMRVGQRVTIKVDAYPGKKYEGHVQSIQAGSGARFSVLPAENATGNFVKIVQRVPVKIVFDSGPNTDDSRLLSPGLSVRPKVKVR